MNISTDPRNPICHMGLDRLPSIRASKSPGLGSLLFPPEERPPCLLCPWSDIGEGSSEGTKGVTQRPTHIVRAKHCDVHLHGACSPALFEGSPLGLATHGALFLLPSSQMPSASTSTDFSFDNGAILIPTDLGGVLLYRALCPSLSRRDIHVLGKGGDVTLMPMFKHPHL